MRPLLEFYEGGGTDDRGRLLVEILAHDDDWLEYTHDYIQWLFPLREPSGVNPSAPLIDAQVAAAFQADEALRGRLRTSFERMLRFYGLQRLDGRIVKGENWAARKRNWFTHGTHNDLRITRILKSLAALGLRADSERFLECLLALRDSEPDCGFGETALRFWRQAPAYGSC